MLTQQLREVENDNHGLSCAQQNLLWHRENLRNEVCRLINDAVYYYDKKECMYDNFKKIGVYKDGRQVMPLNDAWDKAVKMIYNWS